MAIAVVLLGVAGLVTGIAGFGFALVGTMGLATVIGPRAAVPFMLLPIVAANASLLRELDAGELPTCARRFGPYVLATLVGTIAGMVLLDRLPARPLTIGLGVLTLGYVLASQDAIEVPGLEALTERCFVSSRRGTIALGAVSGIVFGATNVGVQIIAYLQSRDLSHSVFVGVIGMTFLGINGVRVFAAGVLGLYPSLEFVGLSLAAIVPGLAGVAVGKRIRVAIPAERRELLVLGLLTVIGIRLLVG